MKYRFLFLLLVLMLAIGGSLSAQQVLFICSPQLPCPGFPLGSVQAGVDQNGWRNFKLTLTQNVTQFSFIGVPPPAQASVTVIFTQDATGSRTVTFASNISNPCTVAGTANATTLCQFEFDGIANTWFGISGGGGIAGPPFYFNYTDTNNGLPAFDAAVEALPSSTFTAPIANKRTIGFLSGPTDHSNVNTLATVDFEAFAPVVTGINTASVIGYDLYWAACCASFPATVSQIEGMSMQFSSNYNGPTTGIAFAGMIGTGGNTGISFGPGELSAAADLAINEQNAYMKNSLGRAQFADAMTCTMAAGTCSAQTIPSTVAPGQAFNSTPKCIGLTWTGTGTLTGILKCVCTTTTCTPSSTVNTDTAQVNFIAIGN